jgi:hypothetical protein
MMMRAAIKLEFVGSLLSTQHWGERSKTGWLGIRIMCLSGVTYVYWCCVLVEWYIFTQTVASVNYYFKNPTSVLIQYKIIIIIISSKVTCSKSFLHWKYCNFVQATYLECSLYKWVINCYWKPNKQCCSSVMTRTSHFWCDVQYNK